MTHRPRVVVALQDRTECAAVADWLTAKEFEPLPRSDGRAAMDEMDAQAFDLLITDAAFAVRDGLRKAERARNTRIPVILIGNAAEEPKGHAVNGQEMFLARPLDQAMLMCFVLMAILDHRPSRRSMRKPVNHVEAYVNGLPVRIVDVSNEGLCLVTPPDRSSLLPPCFKVRIPLLGVSVAAQRVWGRRSKPGTSTTWYGGALTQNSSAAEQGWRSFVDTIPVVHGTHWTIPGH
jgi:CheY-like chemotaxis protein